MSSSSLSLPRRLATRSGIALARAAARLPWQTQMRIGRQLGRRLMAVAHRRRRIAEVNLRLCFPELDEAKRGELLERHFESLGMGLMETAFTWFGRDAQFEGLARIEGLEHLDEALARGRGVILLSAHFTTLEIAGRLLARERRFHVLYREHKNPLFEAEMRASRERLFEKAIPRDDMRGFLRSLKAGHAVWYAPDQDHGIHHAVFVDFFGVQAAMITGTHRLARISGAPVVPFFPKRLAGDAGYHLRILPPLDRFPTGDVHADTQRISTLIEQAVRECPEQYLWVHRRFKTRPAGQRSPYDTP
ncbi:MAG: LpxL/LpxP family Kdo(2)-lipid IV(A) lauroyl/palmitoleoyl acyltransferase [Gammaproteobacteria bacterium]|nr:MAG: LpxL/LpxP family Kdo(2)-lipid IV(A) lauroyl/palmitoleoyl acyltransferase [Gammaproteobacteria bacterium]